MRNSRLLRRLADKLHGYPNRDVLVKRGLKLGHNVFLGDGVYIDPSHCWLIEIGDESVISFMTVILAHDASTRKRLGFSRVARVRVGREVFVGCRAIILPGVTIGDGAVVGAGAVVTTDVLPRTVVAGNPATFIKTVDEFLARRAEMVQTRPCWPLQGWTVSGRISEEHKRVQWETLATGEAYVE